MPSRQPVEQFLLRLSPPPNPRNERTQESEDDDASQRNIEATAYESRAQRSNRDRERFCRATEFAIGVRAALIVALTIPFSLLFASIWLDLSHIPANLLSLGALDFGMVVDGAVVMVENIVRHLNRHEKDHSTILEQVRSAAREVQRPVFYAIAIIITAYLPIFTLQRVEGKLFKPMAWTVMFALLGALLFSMLIAPALASFVFRKGGKSWRNPVMTYLAARYRVGVSWAIRNRTITFAAALAVFALTTILKRVGCSTGRSAGLAPFSILSM